jgi:hypothetical protein
MIRKRESRIRVSFARPLNLPARRVALPRWDAGMAS